MFARDHFGAVVLNENISQYKNPPITHLSGEKPATIAPPPIMKNTQEKII
jgi:hypothetical protein